MARIYDVYRATDAIDQQEAIFVFDVLDRGSWDVVNAKRFADRLDVLKERIRQQGTPWDDEGMMVPRWDDMVNPELICVWEFDDEPESDENA